MAMLPSDAKEKPPETEGLLLFGSPRYLLLRLLQLGSRGLRGPERHY